MSICVPQEDLQHHQPLRPMVQQLFCEFGLPQAGVSVLKSLVSVQLDLGLAVTKLISFILDKVVPMVVQWFLSMSILDSMYFLSQHIHGLVSLL
jgi:hypothetical protein